jgi:hypothetical protein
MKRLLLNALVAAACTGCVAPVMRSSLHGPPTPAQSAELWEAPDDLADRNLFDGPWGKALAPDPTATYAFVSAKAIGISPGFAVTDANGMEWSVKQGPEAKVEVVMSRVLSAVGYHQPPVYYLGQWTISGAPASGVQSEGRFRPKHTVLKDEGEWSWQENPFIGTRPYNGLRVLMLILNESDLKNSNNSLYTVKKSGETTAHRWYVVRDIGTALGETGRLNPTRSDTGKFDRSGFIKGVRNGSVDFDYQGRHQELADHISPDDVRWMCDLLARLSDQQWHDAFRAGGYDTATADRFIARLKQKIAAGQAIGTPVLAPAAAAVPQPPIASDAQLLHKYVWSTLGFDGLLSATISSGLDQWHESPPEWDVTRAGYTKRFASEYAESAIGDIAKYAVAHVFHHDPSFTRCQCTGVARRLHHAVDSPFMARTRSGRRVLSAASLSGFLAGHVASASTWYPAPLGTRDGLKHAALSLVAKIGVDVFKEFRPRRSR